MAPAQMYVDISRTLEAIIMGFLSIYKIIHKLYEIDGKSSSRM